MNAQMARKLQSAASCMFLSLNFNLQLCMYIQKFPSKQVYFLLRVNWSHNTLQVYNKL